MKIQLIISLGFFILAISSAQAFERKYGEPDPNSPVVIAGEFIVTNALKHRYIQTIGVGPCVVVSLYDPVTKTAALAHFYGDSEMDTKAEMKFLFETLENQAIPKSRLEVKLIGGWQGWVVSEKVLRDIESSIRAYSLKPTYKDVSSPFAPPNANQVVGLEISKMAQEENDTYKNIRLDLESGELLYIHQNAVEKLKIRSLINGEKYLTPSPDSIDVSRRSTPNPKRLPAKAKR